MSDVAIVDVSLYQLVTDAACVSQHVFLTKASQGQKKYAPDPQVENTYQVVRRNPNTAFAPYHYFWRSTTIDSGKRQAENMARVLEALVDAHGGRISDLNWMGKPLVWLDVDPVYSDGGEPVVSQNQMENQIWKFINNINSLLGAEVGIYTSQWAWTSVTGPGKNRNTDIPKDRPLWVSNPRTGGQPLMPWDWEKRYGADCWKIWQYSFTGRVPGIMKPNTPSQMATVDLNRANGGLEWFNDQFKTKLTPKAVMPPVEPPVVEQPTRVEIQMNAGEMLKVRRSPFGEICAQTWDGVQFPVIGKALDGQGRPWWQVGPELFVASWYCKAVE